jgi:hypothetical protein
MNSKLPRSSSLMRNFFLCLSPAFASNKSSIVMEMVEVIDGNYQENSQHARQDAATQRNGEARDSESNLKTTSLRESLSSQMSKRQRKSRRRGENEASASSSASRDGDEDNKAANKIESDQSRRNGKLKTRKKLTTGDLSCMKSGFIPAPRVSNADIKYIR